MSYGYRAKFNTENKQHAEQLRAEDAQATEPEGDPDAAPAEDTSEADQ